MAESWKTSKEAFVADHAGGSLDELVAALLVAPVCCGLRLRAHRDDDGAAAALAKDAACLVVPLALLLTVAADYAPVTVAVAAYLLARRRRDANAATFGDAVRLLRAGQAVRGRAGNSRSRYIAVGRLHTSRRQPRRS